MTHHFFKRLFTSHALFIGIFSLVCATLFAQAPIRTDSITITSPTMGQRLNTNKINVVGALSPEVGDLIINNQLVSTKPDGTFAHPVSLSVEGENQISIQIFNKKRLFLQPVLLEELSLFVIYQPTPQGLTPTLVVLSPEDSTVTKKNEILFKGETKNAIKATIDGDALTLDGNGKFYEQKTITAVNTPQTFVIEVISKDNIKVTEKRTVTYTPDRLSKPEITITTPEQNAVLTDSQVTFKGSVKNADALIVNEVAVQLDKNGTFTYRAPLTKKNQYHEFAFTATSKDNQKTTLNRRIYFSDPKSAAKKEEPKKPETKPQPKVETKPEVKPETKTDTKTDSKPDAKAKATAKTEPKVEPKKEAAKKEDAKKADTNKETPKKEEPKKPITPPATPKQEQVPNASITPTPKQSEKELAQEIAREMGHDLDTNDASRLNAELSSEISDSETVKALPDTPKALPNYLSEDMKAKLNKRITLELEGADLRDVLKIISKKSGLNIVSDNSISGSVNIILYDTTIKDTIDYLLDTQGLSYRIVDNTILIASDRKLDVATQLDTAIVKLNNVDAESVTGIIKTYLTKGEFVQFSKANNLIILYADNQKLQRLTDIIQGIDAQEEPQIFLEVQVIETSTAELKSRGISWPSSIGVGVEANITNTGTTIRSNPSFQALIQLLESEGKAKILARPRLKAVNNDQAEIFIGERVPITQTTVDTTGRVAENVSFVDTGILLRVLPSINPNTKEVKLKIQPEVSIISGYRGPHNDKPVIRSRKVNTSVWVKDGETVIIGGLFNSTDTKDITKVPLLGSVPLIGNLFSSSRKDNVQTELLITVTPKIVGRAQAYYEAPATN